MELFAVITGKFHYNFIVSKRIAVVGADLDLIDDLRGSDYEVVGYFSMQNKNYEVDFLGNHMSIEKLKSEVKLVVAVDDTKLRDYIWTNHSGRVVQYISESASVSKHATVGDGAVVYPNVYISAGVQIKKLVKISVGSQIHHESQIGEYSVLAPRALVLGRVQIGSHVFLGSNSSIAPDVEVKNGAIVGMNSNVLKNVEVGTKVWGNPAKLILSKNQI